MRARPSRDSPSTVALSTRNAATGKGDSAALGAAVKTQTPYLGFVGSRKKMASLKKALTEAGGEPSRLDAIKAPAGLDIGAITPDEIAFSIIAELIEFRRRGQRTV